MVRRVPYCRAQRARACRRTNQELLTSFARYEKTVFGVVGMGRAVFLSVYRYWVRVRAKRKGAMIAPSVATAVV
jgi:hypothetical protein